MCHSQKTRNERYARKYFERNRREFDFSSGVDGVLLGDVEAFEDQWSKIINRIGGSATK
jgi:hypothetical protein